MALLFFDGFGHYATADFGQKYDGTTANRIILTGGTTVGDEGEGYTAQYLHVEYGGSTTSWVDFSPYAGGAVDTVIVGIRLYNTVYLAGTFYGLQIKNADGNQVTLQKGVNDFSLILRRGDYNGTELGRTDPVLLGTHWQYLEWKTYIHDTNGYSEVRVNGQTLLRVDDVDTKFQSSSGATRFALRRSSGTNQYYNSMYICDDSGTMNNDFLGECYVTMRPTISDGDTQHWVPNTGESWDAVNDEQAIDEDTSYIEAYTKGDKTLHTYANVYEEHAYGHCRNYGDIKGVAVNLSTKLDKTGTGMGVTGVVTIDGEDYLADLEKEPGTSYEIYQGLWERNPATGSAWTPSSLGTSQIGAVVTSSPSSTTTTDTPPPATTSTTSTTTTAPPDYWWTDFSEYTSDTAPGDWTERYNTGSGSITVRDWGAYGGKCLQVDNSASAQYAASWDDVGSVRDLEILARLRVVADTNSAGRVIWRGSGGAGTENCYLAQLRRTDGHFGAARYISGTYTALNRKNSTLAEDTRWNWIRARMIGNRLRAKIWDGSISAEPSTWVHDFLDTKISDAGWAGVMQYVDATHVDFFSVATNGGTAIGPSTTTTGPPEYWETDFSEYARDANASDWTRQWRTTQDIKIKKILNSVVGGNQLLVDASGSGYLAHTWDDIGDVENAEALVLFMKGTASSGEDWGGACLRVSGSSGSENAYYLAWDPGDNTIKLRTIKSGATVLVDTASKTIGYNTWYWLRLKVNGHLLYGKAWEYGTTEPSAWDVEYADTTRIPAGKAGTFWYDSDTYLDRIDYFAVATNGGTPEWPTVVTTTTAPPEYWETAFDEYTQGVQPSDWTNHWDTSGITWTKEFGGKTGGGSRLFGDRTADNAYGLGWNDTNGTDGSVEVLACAKQHHSSAGTDAGGGIVIRGAGDGASERGYVFNLDEASQKILLRRFDAAGYGTTTLSNPAFTMSLNTWYWIRFRLTDAQTGVRKQIRVWEWGTTEPGTWNIDYTSSGVGHISTPGWVGVYERDVDSSWDCVSIATGGGTPYQWAQTTTSTTSTTTTTTAPPPPPTTTTIPPPTTTTLPPATTTTTTAPPPPTTTTSRPPDCWYDDPFNGSNGSPADAEKWEYVSPATTTDFQIQSNQLRAYIDFDDTTREIQSLWELTGDFDIRVDLDASGNPTTNSWWIGFGIRRGAYKVKVFRKYYGQHGYRTDFDGSTEDHHPYAETDCKFRIARAGSTVTVYRWTGSDWSQLRSETWGAYDCEVFFETQSWSGNPTATGYFNNFDVFEGCENIDLITTTTEPPVVTTTTAPPATTTTTV
jgi:hypothetical protein